MRPGILLRVLALLLVIPAAGCFQQVGQVPRDLEVELLPARRSERSIALQATSSLPMTVIAPTPLQDGPAIAPTVADAADGLFITPRSPDVPSMAEGESGGFTTFSLPTPTLTPRPPGVDEVSAECVHIVSGGDTVYGIALQYDSTVEDMRAANPSLSGDNPIIFPGQQLVIASCAELQSGDFVSPVSAIVTPAPALIVLTSMPFGFRVHIVRSGETLFNIALNYGLTTEDLIDANNLPDPDRLDVGQEIVIPPGG